MDTRRPLLIPLDEPERCSEEIVGGKAARLAELRRAGFNVPRGFSLTVWAYEDFVRESGVDAAIAMELRRKPLEGMRWEELWDAALRIRSAFLGQPLSRALRDAIARGLDGLDRSVPLAVRSSATGEDSSDRSFAGLHESVLGVRDEESLEGAVRLVWASLWSDAALLYRNQLGLDPATSRMAVLVQEMVAADRSGVAFARDPRQLDRRRAIIEAVPGPCSLLVDGEVDPDRWELDRDTGRVVSWLQGQRDGEPEGTGGGGAPLLTPDDLEKLLQTLLALEELCHWAPDMEWTGRGEALTVLQARPITAGAAGGDGDSAEDRERAWYLTLRPGDRDLRTLRGRVENELIPELLAEGRLLASERLEPLTDAQLADALERRSASVARWLEVYRDSFIPFAHGVRRLATYYNDAVRPDDPYEFVGLLAGQSLLATQRNAALQALARQVAASARLRTVLEDLLERRGGGLTGEVLRSELEAHGEESQAFSSRFEELGRTHLDVTVDGVRLGSRPEPFLRNILELAREPAAPGGGPVERSAGGTAGAVLRERLLAAVGAERRDEALDLIETGRVSWRLRDDDNILVARLESQLQLALELAAERLRASGRIVGARPPRRADAEAFARALREPAGLPVPLGPVAEPIPPAAPVLAPGETLRQLIGQPASPGVSTGPVRWFRGPADLGAFRRGDVLVCDAVQPMMTHLVPLASAVVERRGGMLIHGAIIARELGIPSVNGLRRAVEALRDGDVVTVDGHLGIVTVGAAELDLERAASAG